MKSKILLSGIVMTLSLFSTLSFAECGMDRKLELIRDINLVRDERTMILQDARSDKKSERRLKELDEQERSLLYEYNVVCNVE